MNEYMIGEPDFAEVEERERLRAMAPGYLQVAGVMQPSAEFFGLKPGGREYEGFGMVSMPTAKVTKAAASGYPNRTTWPSTGKRFSRCGTFSSGRNSVVCTSQHRTGWRLPGAFSTSWKWLCKTRLFTRSPPWLASHRTTSLVKEDCGATGMWQWGEWRARRWKRSGEYGPQLRAGAADTGPR